MSDSYYIGSYRDDALHGPNRGWIVGTFIKDAPRKNDEVEIMYWEFEAGKPSNHPTKISSIIECTFILKGKIKSFIDGAETVLKAGDYIVIQPRTPNNLQIEILEDAAGITVKAPSDPSAKQIIHQTSHSATD